MSKQWQPAVFEVAMGETDNMRRDHVYTNHESVRGETWRSFGINADTGPWGTDWNVTHLPTGYRLVTAVSKTAAQQFCREVADLTDWSTVRPGWCPPEIRDTFTEACMRARGTVFTPTAERHAAP
jgi:hypothetical protein